MFFERAVWILLTISIYIVIFQSTGIIEYMLIFLFLLKICFTIVPIKENNLILTQYLIFEVCGVTLIGD